MAGLTDTQQVQRSRPAANARAGHVDEKSGKRTDVGPGLPRGGSPALAARLMLRLPTLPYAERPGLTRPPGLPARATRAAKPLSSSRLGLPLSCELKPPARPRLALALRWPPRKDPCAHFQAFLRGKPARERLRHMQTNLRHTICCC